MTSPRRLEAGPLIALLGAILLLVSLFLDWYEPGLSAWEVFEVLDLVLAVAAVLGALAALNAAGAPVPNVEPRVLGWVAGIALVVVLATLLNHPPAVGDAADPDLGLWLALAGSALMAAGALLAIARVHITFNVENRRTRTSAVDARRPPAAEERPAETSATRPLGDAAHRPGAGEETTAALPPQDPPGPRP